MNILNYYFTIIHFIQLLISIFFNSKHLKGKNFSFLLKDYKKYNVEKDY